jgi:DNA-binding NarL/FixJ family response regulator
LRAGFDFHGTVLNQALITVVSSVPEKTMSGFRVLLAEDHAAVAAHLRELLAMEHNVVAVVKDGYGLLGAADTLHPDIIVADIALPGIDGIAASTQILEKNPDAKIVLVTVDDSRAMVERGLAAGVMGYVLKLTAGDELLPAIAAAARGEKYLSTILRDRQSSG